MNNLSRDYRVSGLGFSGLGFAVVLLAWGLGRGYGWERGIANYGLGERMGGWGGGEKYPARLRSEAPVPTK